MRLLTGPLRGVRAPAAALLLAAGLSLGGVAVQSAETEETIVMGILGAIFTVVGGWLVAALWRTLRVRVRLARRGVAASAMVTEVFRTSTAVNGVPLWQLRYRYQDPAGAEHEASSDLLRPEEAAKWPRDAAGAVVYDPAQPAASAWLGREETPAQARQAIAQAAEAKGRWLLQWVKTLAIFFGALITAGVIAELVPPLQQLDAWIAQHSTQLLVVTGGAAAAGVVFLIGSVLAMLMRKGRPMSRGDIEHHRRAIRDAAAGPRIWRTSAYRFFGKASGAEAQDEFSMAQLKRAVASGAIFRDGVWRTRACATCGGTLIFLGIFGVMLVVTPLALKLLLFAVLAYAVARISYAAVRA